MASAVEISNMALTLLGDQRITSLEDNSKPAREILAVYEMLRDQLQRRYVWRFCVTRVTLAADSEAPDHWFTSQYTIPADCLRILQVGLYYPRVSLGDINGAPSQDYQLERGKILTFDTGALPLKYCARVEDPGAFDAAFVVAFASRIACAVAEALTQSSTKREFAMVEFRNAISDAVRANAIENPPEQFADDAWLLARR